jgi:O-antigen ligase
VISRLTNVAEVVTRIAIFGLFFSLFFSRALFVLCAVLALTGWLLVGQYRMRTCALLQNRAAMLMIVMVCYIFVASTIMYAGFDTSYALNIYWKLLIIPVIASTMVQEGDLENCWKAYALGAIILLLHIVILQWLPLPWVSNADPASVFFNPLPQAICLAIFAGWCVFRLGEAGMRPLWRVAFLIGVITSTWAVFAVSHQRLAALSWAIMVGAGMLLRFPKRWRISGFIACFVIISSFLFSNDVFRQRMEVGFQEFMSSAPESNYSSMGARREMWSAAWSGIQEAPWLGHGAGSYSRLAEQFFDDPAMCAIGCPYPHQQYLLFWVEGGLVQLAIYVGLLFFIGKYHFSQPGFHLLALPILLVVMLAGFFDSLFWYRGYLYLFVPLIGLLMVQRPSAAIDQSSPSNP